VTVGVDSYRPTDGGWVRLVFKNVNGAPLDKVEVAKVGSLVSLAYRLSEDAHMITRDGFLQLSWSYVGKCFTCHAIGQTGAELLASSTAMMCMMCPAGLKMQAQWALHRRCACDWLL